MDIGKKRYSNYRWQCKIQRRSE